jgi:hypothetical protein
MRPALQVAAAIVCLFLAGFLAGCGAGGRVGGGNDVTTPQGSRTEQVATTVSNGETVCVSGKDFSECSIPIPESP